MKSSRSVHAIFASLLFIFIVTRTSSSTFAAISGRSYAAGSFELSVDGQPAAVVKSLQGGGGFAEVVSVHDSSNPLFMRKHIVSPKFDLLTLKIGFPTSGVLNDWMNETLEGKFPMRDGAIDLVDFEGKIRRQMVFSQAVITEISFPPLDASSRGPGWTTLKLAPEFIDHHVTPNEPMPRAPIKLPSKTKAWNPANFRLEIAGVDCTRVTKIDGFTIKQQILEYPSYGDHAHPIALPSVEFPNLTLTINAVSMDEWLAWFESFIVAGNSSDEYEKAGTLSFLAADRSSILFEIELAGIGIRRFTPWLGHEDESDQKQVQEFQVELYVEQMRFRFYTTE